MKLNDFKLFSVCFFIKLNSLTTENVWFHPLAIACVAIAPQTPPPLLVAIASKYTSPYGRNVFWTLFFGEL